jgi:hypothetical protein
LKEEVKQGSSYMGEDTKIESKKRPSRERAVWWKGGQEESGMGEEAGKEKECHLSLQAQRRGKELPLKF